MSAVVCGEAAVRAGPGTAELLAAWERAVGAPPLERALALLATTTVGDGAEPALAALPVGVRDARLLALHATAFGDIARAIADCPQCAARVECTLDVRALAAAGGDASALTLTMDGGVVQLRRITTADLVAIADAPSPERLVARVVEHIEGSVPPVTVWWEQAARALEAADPLAHLELALRCPDCATEWAAPCDVVAFVWAALEEWATTTLREVHRLARGYGWSEREILALSPARRRRYLDLLAS